MVIRVYCMSVRAIRMRYVMSVNTMSSSNLSSSSISLACNVAVVAVVLTCSVVTVAILLTCTVAVVAQLTSICVTFLSLRCLEITLTEEHKSVDPGETVPGTHAIPQIDPTHKIPSASGIHIQHDWIKYELQHGHQRPPVHRLRVKES